MTMFRHRVLEPDPLLLKLPEWHTTWDFGRGEKQALQQFLWERQNGRCSYCETKLVQGKTRIEHFHSRSLYSLDDECVSRLGSEPDPSVLFSLNNLMLCCDGREGQVPRGDTICDKHKEDAHICAELYNPATSPFPSLVHVSRSGRVMPAHYPSSVWTAQEVLDAVLNLNDSALERRRNDLYIALLGNASVLAKASEDMGADMMAFWNGQAARMNELAETEPFASVYLSVAAEFRAKAQAVQKNQ